MNKAIYIGTISLELIKVPADIKPWQPYETEDIIAAGLITVPKDYMLTLGSGIYFGPHSTYSSLATMPDYRLPTTSQWYVAGRDVIRWGGEKDPYEIDYDHYVFTPDIKRDVAIVSKAPRSEIHHFSENPQKITEIPDNWQELFNAIRNGELIK